jgi:AcrR family transcriptional regulator
VEDQRLLHRSRRSEERLIPADLSGGRSLTEILTIHSIMAIGLVMARPVEFDRRVALERAMKVFWAKGFSAASTEDLVQAMRIGRQSLYNAFGDKRRLYAEALAAYQRRTTAAHLKRLNEPASAIAGIRRLLRGLIAEDRETRALGCMGVTSVGEFGATDTQLNDQRGRTHAMIQARLVERIHEAQAAGEIDPALDADEAATFVQMTMTAIQLGARAGTSAAKLKRMADFTVDRLKAR